MRNLQRTHNEVVGGCEIVGPVLITSTSDLESMLARVSGPFWRVFT